MKSKKSTRRRRIVATQKHKSKSGKRHVSRKTRKSRSVRGGNISTGALVGTTALVGTGAYITYQQYQQHQKRTEITHANLKKTEITRALEAFNTLRLETLVDVIDTFSEFLHDAESIIKFIQRKFVNIEFKTILKPNDFMLYQFSGFNLYSLQGDLKIDSDDDDDKKLKNVLYQMVLWFIADCSFAIYHIVKSIQEQNIWKITKELISTVYNMIQYYLLNNNKNQFIQNYSVTYENVLQFTKQNAAGGYRHDNQNTHTPEEEANMLYDEYAKYFTAPRTMCFNV